LVKNPALSENPCSYYYFRYTPGAPKNPQLAAQLKDKQIKQEHIPASEPRYPAQCSAQIPLVWGTKIVNIPFEENGKLIAPSSLQKYDQLSYVVEIPHIYKMSDKWGTKRTVALVEKLGQSELRKRNK
jgi:hypothetical protein